MNKPHIAIICNPRSGGGKPLLWLDAVAQAVKAKQWTYEVFTQHLPNELTDFTGLVILGGDGTLNYSLNHFNHINIPIGIVPCGTGNDTAYHLLGKRPIKDYIETALSGSIQYIDAGTCNGRIFINGAGIGFDGWVAKLMQGKKLLSGKTGYYITVLRLLLFYREVSSTVLVDGKEVNTSLFMLSAANGTTYGGGFKVAPKAKMDDGLLDVVLVKRIGLFNRLRYLPVIEKGKHLDKSLPFMNYKQAKQISISSSKPLQAHLDGEWMESNSFTINLLAAKYQIRC